MATIDKKLIHFNRLADFEARLAAGDVRDYSIVCIKDAKKIWTHGVYYGDLSAYLTSEEIAEMYATNDELDGKQDKVLKFENMVASAWVDDTAYGDYPYRCDITCNGVTAENYAEVVFSLEQATAGSYAPVCETGTDKVSVWSADNTSITIPTILITI